LLSLTDVMSKQKFSGWLRLGSCTCGEPILAGCNLSSSRFLHHKGTWNLSAVYCVPRSEGPSHRATQITFFYRDKCNLCHLHGSCEATQSHIL
jgi:hypothetical protein